MSVRAPRDRLAHALVDCVRLPHRNLILAWSWKAAIVSALVRALVFLVSNRHNGLHDALKAMTVEAGFSVFASGLLGAMTQRLRDTRPLWATAVVVWAAMPLAMVAGEAGVHHLFHTPHVRAGLVSSFLFAALASGYTWFAMRRGILLQGVGDDSLRHDVKLLPRVTWDFVLWPFRLLKKAKHSR